MTRHVQPVVKPRRACFGYAGQSEHLRLRRLQAGDCVEQLTGMLHRAFSRIG